MNKIIPFSSVDGPGNRTSVFLQGCNFNCRYCHNPETRKLCINCGDCVPKCPVHALSMVDGKVTFDYTKCVACDTCIKTCTHDASPRIRWMTPQEVFEEVKKQVPYIRGITTSGGECTFYPDFLRALFKLCKGIGLGALIDSNGSYDFSKDEELLDVCDGVMLDVKSWTAGDHHKVVDFSNEMVLKNLDYLAEKHKLYEVRTVVVPGLFDVEKTIREVSEHIKNFPEVRYKIITYRPMGVREKYAVEMNPPKKDYMNRLKELSESIGVKTVVLV